MSGGKRHSEGMIMLDKNDTQIIASSLKRLAEVADKQDERLAKQEVSTARQEEAIKGLGDVVKLQAKSSTDAMNKLAEQMGTLVEQVSTLTEQTTHIETKALGRLDSVEEDVSSIKDDVADIHKRVETIELERATEKGAKAEKDKASAFWQNNWFKMFSVFVVLIPLIYVLYDLVLKAKT